MPFSTVNPKLPRMFRAFHGNTALSASASSSTCLIRPQAMVLADVEEDQLQIVQSSESICMEALGLYNT